MDTKQLFEEVAHATGLDFKTAKVIGQSIFEVITREMSNGEPVRINKFGVFTVQQRDARKGFNPKTKQALEIPAKNCPVFKPSKTLKERSNG